MATPVQDTKNIPVYTEVFYDSRYFEQAPCDAPRASAPHRPTNAADILRTQNKISIGFDLNQVHVSALYLHTISVSLNARAVKRNSAIRFPPSVSRYMEAENGVRLSEADFPEDIESSRYPRTIHGFINMSGMFKGFRAH